MKSRFFGSCKWFAVLFISAPVASWAALGGYAPPPAAAKPSGAPATNPSLAAGQPVTKPAVAAKPYILRATDVVSVNVLNDTKASQDYKIDQDGGVTMAYLDEPVHLAGLSVNDATKAVAKAYTDQKIFVNPKVTILVKEFAQRRINFIGQVNKPGWVLIPPQEELSLVQAFTQTGGPTRNAARTCTITRMLPNGTSQTVRVNLWAAVKDAKLDSPLQEGDTVSLGESVFGDAWFD